MKTEGFPRAVSFLCALTVGLLGHARATAATLDSVSQNWPELNLRASLGGAGPLEVEQGSNLQLRIAADDEACVAIVLVNPGGQAQLVIPARADTGDRIVRGTEMLFPDVAGGEVLYADMSAGKAYAYVIASQEPVLRAPQRREWVPAADIAALLVDARRGNPGLRLAMRRLPMQVIAPATRDFVSTEEFVQFFGIATRSVRDVDRGFRVEFGHNSAELTDWSRRQLEAVGKGMLDARLADFPFTIEGHTDDLGSDDYNMSLSARRADAVRTYLSRIGIDGTRLQSSAMGESRPAMPGSTEQARAANRRVVIRRIDGAQ